MWSHNTVATPHYPHMTLWSHKITVTWHCGHTTLPSHDIVVTLHYCCCMTLQSHGVRQHCSCMTLWPHILVTQPCGHMTRSHDIMVTWHYYKCLWYIFLIFSFRGTTRYSTYLSNKWSHVQGSQGGLLSRFHDNNIPSSQCRAKLPCLHQQREVPGNHLSNNSNRLSASVAQKWAIYRKKANVILTINIWIGPLHLI